jgi:hypothetical protein
MLTNIHLSNYLASFKAYNKPDSCLPSFIRQHYLVLIYITRMLYASFLLEID